MLNKCSEAAKACASESALMQTDLQKVQEVDSFDTLIKKVHTIEDDHNVKLREPDRYLLKSIQDTLPSFRNLTIMMETSGECSEGDTAIIWGVMYFIAQECVNAKAESTILLSIFSRHLEEMGDELQIFKSYQWLFRQSPDLCKYLGDNFLDIVTFWSRAVKHLKRTRKEIGKVRSIWQSETSDFDATIEQIRKRARIIKDEAQALEQERMIQGNSRSDETLPIEDVPKVLPCYMFAFAQNPNFFGRAQLLEDLRHRLDHDCTCEKLRSCTLWGMGGVGKTQTALAYVWERREKGVQAIFWINSETKLELAQAFTNVALKLQLKGAVDGAHRSNAELVKSWLQTTDAQWLIVFDNVEGPDDIQDYWPITNRGSILITSRKEVLALTPAAGGIEVPVFDEGEGLQYLLETVGRQDYSASEKEAAVAVVKVLDGLPLALNMMSAQIRLRKLDIADFLAFYRKYLRHLHKKPKGGLQNPYYAHALDTCWRVSFEPLDDDEECSAIFGVLCFISPEDVPEELFTGSDTDMLPPTIGIHGESWTFLESVRMLLGNSLISKRHGTSSLQIHRLIQEEYRFWLTSERRYQCFVIAAKLLRDAFPKQIKGGPLRNEWNMCKKYIQHAIALCDRWREFKFTSQRLGDFLNLTELLTNCAWYLIETGEWDIFWEVVNVAFETCEEKESLLYAHLCNSAGLVETERVRMDEAIKYVDRCRKLREKLLDENDQELSVSYINTANVLLTMHRSEACYDEAIEYIWKAHAIETSKSEIEQKGLMHLQHLILGAAFTYKGVYDQAIDHIGKAQTIVRANMGVGSHFDANADYKFGLVYYKQKDWETSRSYYEKALKVWKANNPVHPSTTSTQLKLGIIAMRQGRLDDAIQIFREIVPNCRRRESLKGDAGDTARVLRRLAEALDLKGEEDGDLDLILEGELLKIEAEHTRKQVQGTRYFELPDCELSYDLMVYHGFR